jgi:hypothetical protein
MHVFDSFPAGINEQPAIHLHSVGQIATNGFLNWYGHRYGDVTFFSAFVAL